VRVSLFHSNYNKLKEVMFSFPMDVKQYFKCTRTSVRYLEKFSRSGTLYVMD
jgi:hypothetical protein